MKKFLSLPLLMMALTFFLFSSCDKKKDQIDPTSDAFLIFEFKFDSTQTRLNNFGQPASVKAGNAAQSPRFNTISAHYVEMTKNMFTQVGKGALLYDGPSTTAGGDKAIDFEQAKIVKEGETFLKIPLKDITAGNYEYLRVSLSYQNYDIDFRAQGMNLTGTLASFIGYNNYIKNYKIKNLSKTVNGNKLQGFWGFETINHAIEGQAPPGAVTVPNPIASTSPLPAGSCLVTGKFAVPLEITGNETKDIKVIVSLSNNKSFEWKDNNSNGVFEPDQGEVVVDMGIRGLIPIVQK